MVGGEGCYRGEGGAEYGGEGGLFTEEEFDWVIGLRWGDYNNWSNYI